MSATKVTKIAATVFQNDPNSCHRGLPTKSVRRIPTNRRSTTGYVAFRGNAAVPFESALERDFVLLQRHSASVLQVLSQPCQVPFVGHSGSTHIYTPDFLVSYRTSTAPLHMQTPPLLVEVKPSEEWRANWRAWMPKWKAARRYAQEMGWRFKIMDEARIRTQALDNINFLRRYDDLDVEFALSDQIVEDLEGLGVASFDYLLAKHFAVVHRAEGIAHLWHLLSTRRIDCDINLPLNHQTELWVPSYD